MSLYYPNEKKLTPNLVEAYVQGMYDLYIELGGETLCKSYDPLTIEGDIAHSYVLNFNDGGRHHKLSLKDIKEMALKEFVELIKEIAD